MIIIKESLSDSAGLTIYAKLKCWEKMMARPLKPFMRGKTVGMLQEILMRHGYAIHDQKSVFGADTREAVKSFQKQRNLSPTGIVDDELMQLLQFGQAKASEKSSKEEQNTASDTVKSEKQHVNPQKLDALVRLLIKKGVLEEGELEAEMKKAVPNSLF